MSKRLQTHLESRLTQPVNLSTGLVMFYLKAIDFLFSPRTKYTLPHWPLNSGLVFAMPEAMAHIFYSNCTHALCLQWPPSEIHTNTGHYEYVMKMRTMSAVSSIGGTDGRGYHWSRDMTFVLHRDILTAVVEQYMLAVFRRLKSREFYTRKVNKKRSFFLGFAV